jgi:hypothetical protein
MDEQLKPKCELYAAQYERWDSEGRLPGAGAEKMSAVMSDLASLGDPELASAIKLFHDIQRKDVKCSTLCAFALFSVVGVMIMTGVIRTMARESEEEMFVLNVVYVVALLMVPGTWIIAVLTLCCMRTETRRRRAQLELCLRRFRPSPTNVFLPERPDLQRFYYGNGEPWVVGSATFAFYSQPSVFYPRPTVAYSQHPAAAYVMQPTTYAQQPIASSQPPLAYPRPPMASTQGVVVSAAAGL